MHISGWACLLFLHPCRQANFPRGREESEGLVQKTECSVSPLITKREHQPGLCICTSERPQGKAFLPCGQGIQAHQRVKVDFQHSHLHRAQMGQLDPTLSSLGIQAGKHKERGDHGLRSKVRKNQGRPSDCI